MGRFLEQAAIVIGSFGLVGAAAIAGKEQNE
jgi:hypothetical protein